MGNLIKDNKLLSWSFCISISRTIRLGSIIRFVNVNFGVRPIVYSSVGLISINIILISVRLNINVWSCISSICFYLGIGCTINIYLCVSPFNWSVRIIFNFNTCVMNLIVVIS